MTVARLDSELGPGELDYWIAYFERSPTLRDQLWMMSALMRSQICLAAGIEAPSEIKDLMPPDLWSADVDT